MLLSVIGSFLMLIIPLLALRIFKTLKRILDKEEFCCFVQEDEFSDKIRKRKSFSYAPKEYILKNVLILRVIIDVMSIYSMIYVFLK